MYTMTQTNLSELSQYLVSCKQHSGVQYYLPLKDVEIYVDELGETVEVAVIVVDEDDDDKLSFMDKSGEVRLVTTSTDIECAVMSKIRLL